MEDILFLLLFDKDSNTGMYNIHHKDRTIPWSVYIRDLVITSVYYHPVYGGSGTAISSGDSEILSEGLQMLKKLGADRYKKGQSDWAITIDDIKAVFTTLGGGTLYTLVNGRTVIEQWQQGSKSGVHPSRSFTQRLAEFNKRIRFLVDNNFDYEIWLNKFYSSNAPNWIIKGKIQLDQYEWMADKLGYTSVMTYIHLEDLDFIQNTWGNWFINP
ncbi:hypothetical protein LCGC14_0870390 [marine sediment metagenome]|uniref:Uncharacterized protein n=1 Tax=marine sediment metagenome TaxID=412755 RepID=A0A0F9SBV7_9ZZZZ|nr:MAG: hypothetical protein Lokiarch_16410 [Candidatus Lokiarchaeum sp. GC14_75]